MRAVGLITAALLGCSAHASDEVPPPGAAWGCSSAAYFDPVEIAGSDRPVYRSLYSSFFADGPDSDIVEHVLTLPENLFFDGPQPFCWDFNGDRAPDPVAVTRTAEGAPTLVAYALGKPLFEIAYGLETTHLSLVAVQRLGSSALVDIAYLRFGDQGGDLVVTRLRDGWESASTIEKGFADPTGIDHRVADFVRDCGGGPELALPSTGWETLDVIAVTDDGLERATLAEKPDFSRLVRALECTPE